MKKKTLLVFASTFPRWKNDTNPPFVYELSKRLTDEFDVHVLAPSFPGAKDYEVMDKMQVHRFHYFFKKYEKLAGSGGILPTLKKNKWFFGQVPFFMAAEFFALKKLVKQIKPDIIHSHWIIPQGFVTALVHKLTGVPYVVTTWGGDMFVFKKKGILASFLKGLYAFTLNNSKKSTTVNTTFLLEMKSIIKDQKKAIYLPNGTDTSLFSPSKKDKLLNKKYNIQGPFLLFVGRLTEKKGIEYLIQAMKEVVRVNKSAKLLIVGAGDKEKDLKLLSSNLDLGNNILFTGPIQNKELPRFYASADLFIAPSITTKQGDREGFPTVFIEAMASGTPILTTKIDGIKDIIVNEKNGFIVDQRSSKQLAERINHLIKSKSKLSSMKKSATQLAKSYYDWKIVSNGYTEVLK